MAKGSFPEYGKHGNLKYGVLFPKECFSRRSAGQHSPTETHSEIMPVSLMRRSCAAELLKNIMVLVVMSIRLTAIHVKSAHRPKNSILI